ncbi:MAG: hypothetical protein KBC30_01165 [Planctomycetes bacterium]|nr:hypothetical protein [Planctomycetota bacterium]
MLKYKMQTLITDTCALIYLYHADLLRYIERMYQLITIPEVLQELSVKATKNEQKVYYQILEIVTVKNTKQRSFSKKLSETDKKLLQLYYENEHVHGILTEDGGILQYCNANSIVHYCCLSLITQFVRQNILSIAKAEEHIHYLIHIGRYAPWVVHAQEMDFEKIKKDREEIIF